MKSVLILMTIFLMSCATSPVPLDKTGSIDQERIYEAYAQYKEPNEDNSKVVVVRDSGVLGSAGSAALFVNGEIIARIRTSEKIELNLKAGDNVIGVGSGTKLSWEKDNTELVEQTLYAEKNKTYYFRVSIAPGKGLILQRTTQLK